MPPAPERPVFCGNFEYDASEKEIYRLFEKYGEVDRIDMKTGFAFVYMKRSRDGDDAIRDLDRREWGYKRRPLRVEWAKRTEDKSKNQAPTKTLFVVNFDVLRTRVRDIEDLFVKYGPLSRVEIKRNYAFVEFESLDDAIKAQRDTDTTQWNGRTLTVEFVTNKDGPSKSGAPRNRSRSRSPYGRARRSVSPVRRRISPNRSRSPARRASPSPGRYRDRSRSPYGNGDASPPTGDIHRSRSPR
eukprot:jgi/Chrzof1/7667/Cz02g32080.t1